MQSFDVVIKSSLQEYIMVPTSLSELLGKVRSGMRQSQHSTAIQTQDSCRHSTASPELDQVQPRSQGFFPVLGTRLDQMTTSGSLHLREFSFPNPGNLCRRNTEPRALVSGMQLKESGIPNLVPSRPRRFRMWRYLSSLSGKFAEDASRYRTRFQAFSGDSDCLNWPGYEAPKSLSGSGIKVI